MATTTLRTSVTESASFSFYTPATPTLIAEAASSADGACVRSPSGPSVVSVMRAQDWQGPRGAL